MLERQADEPPGNTTGEKVGEMKVVFIKQIHSCFAGASSNDVWLEREIDMPFVPNLEIEVRHGDWAGRPIEIVWDADAQEFRCYVEPDKELYNANLHREAGRPLAEIVQEWVEDGWQKRGGR